MPFQKGNYKGRPRKTRKKYRKKKKSRGKSKKGKYGISRYNIHEFQRFTPSALEIDLTEVNGGFVGRSMGPYQLSKIIDPIDFTSLYEAYKMIKVQHIFSWSPSLHAGTQYATGISNPQAFAAVPILYYREDYDDSVPPVNLEDLTEHGNCKSIRLNPNKQYTVNVRLAVKDLLQYVRALTPGDPDIKVYETSFKLPLLDTITAGDRVEHLGLKVGIVYPTDLPVGAQWGQVHCLTRYTIRFYGSK